MKVYLDQHQIVSGNMSWIEQDVYTLLNRFGTVNVTDKKGNVLEVNKETADKVIAKLWVRNNA